MAELTNLETKLAEVMGLAMAARDATAHVRKLVDDPDLAGTLKRMRGEAQETQQRCAAVAGKFDGKKTAIQEEARSTKSKATEMMSTYLANDADGLDGFEFLTMAEAGEMGHWAVLGTLAKTDRNIEIERLVAWALPIQERHFNDAQAGSLKLASKEDPNEVNA
jgi:hypothetical protein